jgi:hypothetical protein
MPFCLACEPGPLAANRLYVVGGLLPDLPTSGVANGRYGHPDTEALEMLCDARPDRHWTLWMTYGGACSDGENHLHRRVQTFFERRRRGGQSVDVRYARPDRRSVRVHLGNDVTPW